MVRNLCVHGSLVNDTCVCDLFWQGEHCDWPDCQGGKLKNGTCHCNVRHIGRFCEYHACYHKNTLHCWGLNDVIFRPCNQSAVGYVDPELVQNPGWYCPCGHGYRTVGSNSTCLCDPKYTGEFCNELICLNGTGACSTSTYPTFSQPNPFGDNDTLAVTDSVKVGLICMAMVVLVALTMWLKRIFIRPDTNGDEETGLPSTLFMVQPGHQYSCHWSHPANITRNTRSARLPSYDEANAVPPSYASVMMTRRTEEGKPVDHMQNGSITVTHDTPGHAQSMVIGTCSNENQTNLACETCSRQVSRVRVTVENVDDRRHI